MAYLFASITLQVNFVSVNVGATAATQTVGSTTNRNDKINKDLDSDAAALLRHQQNELKLQQVNNSLIRIYTFEGIIFTCHCHNSIMAFTLLLRKSKSHIHLHPSHTKQHKPCAVMRHTQLRQQLLHLQRQQQLQQRLQFQKAIDLEQEILRRTKESGSGGNDVSTHHIMHLNYAMHFYNSQKFGQPNIHFFTLLKFVDVEPSATGPTAQPAPIQLTPSPAVTPADTHRIDLEDDGSLKLSLIIKESLKRTKPKGAPSSTKTSSSKPLQTPKPKFASFPTRIPHTLLIPASTQASSFETRRPQSAARHNSKSKKRKG